MDISVQDLVYIASRFKFKEVKTESHGKLGVENWGIICDAKFALSEYSG